MPWTLKDSVESREARKRLALLEKGVVHAVDEHEANQRVVYAADPAIVWRPTLRLIREHVGTASQQQSAYRCTDLRNQLFHMPSSSNQMNKKEAAFY